jgi:hypothetical protein
MEGLRRLRVSVQIGGRCRPSNSRRLSSEKASQQDPAHWACVGRAFCSPRGGWFTLVKWFFLGLKWPIDLRPHWSDVTNTHLGSILCWWLMSAVCTASAQRQNSLNSHGSFARHRFNGAGLLCSDDGLLSRASKDDAAAVTAGVHQGSLTRPATLEWTGDRSVLHSSGAACLATKCLQS